MLADRRTQIDIRQTAINENVELIISLGDFAREDLLPLSDITNVLKIGIYGNHDSGQYMEELGIMNLHQMIWHYQGKSFAGLQGCVRYKANPYAIMYTQEEVYDILANYPQVDIFITHCPPRGINDEDEIAHQGFDALCNISIKNHLKYCYTGTLILASITSSASMAQLESNTSMVIELSNFN